MNPHSKKMKRTQTYNSFSSIYNPREENCFDKLYQYLYYFCCFPCGYMYQDD